MHNYHPIYPDISQNVPSCSDEHPKFFPVIEKPHHAPKTKLIDLSVTLLDIAFHPTITPEQLERAKVHMRTVRGLMKQLDTK